MKRFLALLFVCAGLTAMAVNPHINPNAPVKQGKADKVMMTKADANKTIFSGKAAGGMSIQKFFNDKNITPADNKLMKKAPRRVSADDVIGSKIVFSLGYAYNSETNEMDLATEFLFGGWTADMEQTGDNEFEACVYFTSIPFHYTVDYSAGTAEMVMEQLGGWQWKDTVTSGSFMNKSYTVYDTTEYLFIWDEAYIFDDSEDAAPANLQGVLYDDGTLYFEDGWCLYVIELINTKKYDRNWVLQSETNDTVQGLMTDFMESTYLMTPNATHDYVATNSSNAHTAKQVPAYMFQSDDTTVNVWNVWGMGNRGIKMYLRDEGVMEFPSYQYIHTEDVSDYAATYTQYDWSEGNVFYNFAIDLDVEADTADDNTLSEDSKLGTYDHTKIEWDASVVYDLIGANGSWYFGLGFYPFLHNVLTFTTDELFIFGKADMPTITVTEGDEAYTFTGVTAQEGATVYLMTFDYDEATGDITNVVDVDNPYIVQRTDQDQIIYLAAIAEAFNLGLDYSDPYMGQFVVPALPAPAYIRGDVDNNGVVDINDVTLLIDVVLGKDVEFNAYGADCNTETGDGGININDITALIGRVLSGAWED